MSFAGALETVRFSGFDCPSCGQRLFVDSSGPASCPDCRWKGDAYIMRPLREKALLAQEALPDKAVCAHHPTKQAEAVCAGTGDYICMLCAVELDGKIYSAEYLNRAGRDSLEKNYARYMNRPDQELNMYLVGLIFLWILSPVLIPLAIHKFFGALKQRKTDKLYARVVTGSHLAVLGIFLFALTGLYMLIFASIIL